MPRSTISRGVAVLAASPLLVSATELWKGRGGGGEGNNVVIGGSCPNGTGRKLKLVQVQTAFRHGARTPMRDLGKVPCKWTPKEQSKDQVPLAPFQIFNLSDKKKVEFGSIAQRFNVKDDLRLYGGGYGGALTRDGILMAKDLGEELRSRYVDEGTLGGDARAGYLLPGDFSPSSVVFRSTRTQRTIETAQGVATSLLHHVYGSSGRGEEPVSIMLDDGWMVMDKSKCRRLQQLFQDGLSKATKNRSSSEKSLIEHIESDPSGWYTDDSDWALISYRDQLLCRMAASKPIPTSVLKVQHELDVAAQSQMQAVFEGGASFTANPVSVRTEALRLAIGRLVTFMLDTVENPAEHGKIHLYSGHDWTVSPLLMVITRAGEFHEWPPFCSNLSFEIWSEEGGHAGGVGEGLHVRAIYNSKALKLRCGENGEAAELCRYDRFKKMVTSYTIRNFEEACEQGVSLPQVDSAEGGAI